MKILSIDRLAVSGRKRLVSSVIGLAAATWLVTAPIAAAPADEDFFTHLHTEKAMANVTVSPGRSGPVDITIQLETGDERPLAAKGVLVSLSDAQTGRKLPAIAASPVGEDSWHVKIASLSAGRWMLGLGISISETDQVSVESPILIK